MICALYLPESTTTNPAPPITGMASCLTPAKRVSKSSQGMQHRKAQCSTAHCGTAQQVDGSSIVAAAAIEAK